MKSLPTKISAEVNKALTAGKPIVALESTIITHGLPWPHNIETAKELEKIIRQNNVTPATIALIDGYVHIGMETSQLEYLAKEKNTVKVSCADIAFTLSQKLTGSTTVAATMALSANVGIEVFATGGIGGVHQGAENSFDISADLYEFSKSKVIVVASGAKAILDIPKTIEVLESQSVPVICYKSQKFPAFWSVSSNIPAPLTVDSVKQIIDTWHIQNLLFPSSGMLVANPVAKKDEIPNTEIDFFINKAITSANRKLLKGKAVTPFILNELLNLTQGRSLACNKSLVFGNANLASEIAIMI